MEIISDTVTLADRSTLKIMRSERGSFVIVLTDDGGGRHPWWLTPDQAREAVQLLTSALKEYDALSC
jgi:hypothetical protein